MTNENDVKRPQDAMPVCPHCGQDPVVLSWRQVQLSQVQALLIFCGNQDCRKIFAVEAIGMTPQVQLARHPGLLVPS